MISDAHRPAGQIINGERLKLWVADYEHAAACERNTWPVGARVQFDRFGRALADLDAARDALRLKAELLTVTRAELALTEAERLNYRDEIERMRLVVEEFRQRAEHMDDVRELYHRAATAIWAVRDRCAVRESNGCTYIRIADVYAALDAQRPVEDAPLRVSAEVLAAAEPDLLSQVVHVQRGGLLDAPAPTRSGEEKRPACDCGHEFEPEPTQFHLGQCAYRRSYERPKYAQGGRVEPGRLYLVDERDGEFRSRSEAGLPADGEEKR